MPEPGDKDAAVEENENGFKEEAARKGASSSTSSIIGSGDGVDGVDGVGGAAAAFSS
tara:strand:- start:101 stop:271 length:171 start_codon:yes stop_codon:yes gene_type:complete